MNALASDASLGTAKDFPWRCTVQELHDAICRLRGQYRHRLGVYQDRLAALNRVDGHAGRRDFLDVVWESRIGFEVHGTCAPCKHPAINMPLEWPTTDFDEALASLKKWIALARQGITLAGSGYVRYPRLVLGGFVIDTTPRGRCAYSYQERAIRRVLKSGVFPFWSVGGVGLHQKAIIV